MREAQELPKRVDKRPRGNDPFVVIGGGIAGVCCAEEISRLLELERAHLYSSSQRNVILISSSPSLKQTESVMKVTDHLDELRVFESTASAFRCAHRGVELVIGEVNLLDYRKRRVLLTDGKSISFYKLCVCSGARPKLLLRHPRVIGLRDLQSVEQLIHRLATARSVAVIGNGGIALELIHELLRLGFCEVHWVVRDSYIGSAFFDASASAFILPSLLLQQTNLQLAQIDSVKYTHTQSQTELQNRQKRQEEGQMCSESLTADFALGPEWAAKTRFNERLGKIVTSSSISSGSQLRIHFESEVSEWSLDGGQSWLNSVTSIHTESDCSSVAGLRLRTSRREEICCDFAVSATGILPNTEWLVASNRCAEEQEETGVRLDDEGCIEVGTYLDSSVAGVYAAGDCCSYPSPSVLDSEVNEHFFQMRLWSQARLMGLYAAQCMCERQEDGGYDIHFELFSHVTRFFGRKVVMLGRYNAQGLGTAAEHLTRHMIVTGRENESVAVNTSEDPQDISNGRKEDKKSLTAAKMGSQLGEGKTGGREVEVWVRVTPDKEYVKLTIFRGCLVGALLIGDTGLEETMENLILNRLQLGHYGIDILHPEVDIADYFD